MINGIIQTENGFSVKDFETGEVTKELGALSYKSFDSAMFFCGAYFPKSFVDYLQEATALKSAPDADVWENMIYADDPDGIYDYDKEEYRNVTEMDRGAATEEEIAYVDALDATYKSLMAMVEDK